MNRSSRMTKPHTRLDEIVNLLSLKRTDKIVKGYKETTVNDKVSIEPCPLVSGKLLDAEKMFDLSINVWTSHLNDRQRIYAKRRSGRFGSIEINLHQEPTGLFVYIGNDSYFSGYFECTNRKHGCHFTFRDRQRFEKHCEGCQTLEEVCLIDLLPEIAIGLMQK